MYEQTKFDQHWLTRLSKIGVLVRVHQSVSQMFVFPAKKNKEKIVMSNFYSAYISGLSQHY